MNKLDQMQVLVAVADAGSFVRAADALGISKTAVSRLVAELETRLGVRLIQRTTRRLSLTDEGAAFVERCRELLGAVEAIEAEVSANVEQAIGRIRVNVPVSFGNRVLAPLWPRFIARHPNVALEVTLVDRFVDVVDEGFDLAVRVGNPPSSSLIARRLGATRLVLCASPGYLRLHGEPGHPHELERHVTIGYSLLTTGDHWHFVGPDGPVSVRVVPRMHSNSGDTCCAAALADQGIVLEPTFLVHEHLASGALRELMPAFRGPEFAIQAVYPSRRHLAPKVRLLVDFLASALGRPP
ncbi:MAG: LysR family transcriptional regulator [Burkholderiaceae bacterium]